MVQTMDGSKTVITEINKSQLLHHTAVHLLHHVGLKMCVYMFRRRKKVRERKREGEREKEGEREGERERERERWILVFTVHVYACILQ